MKDNKQPFNGTAYKNAFNAKAYDRVNLTIPKGQKEAIKNHAAGRGESINGFIQRAILEQLKRDARCKL